MKIINKIINNLGQIGVNKNRFIIGANIIPFFERFGLVLVAYFKSKICLLYSFLFLSIVFDLIKDVELELKEMKVKSIIFYYSYEGVINLCLMILIYLFFSVEIISCVDNKQYRFYNELSDIDPTNYPYIGKSPITSKEYTDLPLLKELADKNPEKYAEDYAKKKAIADALSPHEVMRLKMLARNRELIDSGDYYYGNSRDNKGVKRFRVKPYEGGPETLGELAELRVKCYEEATRERLERERAKIIIPSEINLPEAPVSIREMNFILIKNFMYIHGYRGNELVDVATKCNTAIAARNIKFNDPFKTLYNLGDSDKYQLIERTNSFFDHLVMHTPLGKEFLFVSRVLTQTACTLYVENNPKGLNINKYFRFINESAFMAEELLKQTTFDKISKMLTVSNLELIIHPILIEIINNAPGDLSSKELREKRSAFISQICILEVK